MLIYSKTNKPTSGIGRIFDTEIQRDKSILKYVQYCQFLFPISVQFPGIVFKRNF